MKYRNTDSTILKSAKISTVAIGTQVVFHNDGLLEDIHTVVGVVSRGIDDRRPLVVGEGRIRTVVNAGPDIEYPFTQDPNIEAFILKVAPTRQELLFDEDES